MSLLNRVQQLPKGFVWGAATAAYQTEGSTKVAGKGKTMWDDYLVAQGRFLPDPASDCYEEDIRLSAEHGLNAIRVSIAWTRIFPNGDDAEPLAEGVKHYHELFACCKKYGVEPYVSLHHFDSPAALFNQGDWLNRKTVDAYVRYAEFCFREFREVKNWFTINELISLSHSQYIQGNFPPNHHFDVTSGIQSQHNELVAHARAVNLYKDLDETEHLGGRIGMVNVLTPAYPATDSPADQHAADLYNAFYTDFIMDGAFLGHYSARTLSLINEILRANNATLTVEDSDMEELAKAAPRNDMFGLNYYQSAFIAAYDGENGTGNILWSWHVWVTDYSPSATTDATILLPDNQRILKLQNGATSYKPIMDRCLGAYDGYVSVPSDILDMSRANGFHYQRARKDPFPGSYTAEKIANQYKFTINAALPPKHCLNRYNHMGDADRS